MYNLSKNYNMYNLYNICNFYNPYNFYNSFNSCNSYRSYNFYNFVIRSKIHGNMVVPPENTTLAYNSFWMSPSHFMLC